MRVDDCMNDYFVPLLFGSVGTSILAISPFLIYPVCFADHATAANCLSTGGSMAVTTFSGAVLVTYGFWKFFNPDKRIDSKLLEELKDEVRCQIIRDVPKDPIVTDCGHFFGASALTQWFNIQKKNNCPMCKNPVQKVFASPFYSQLCMALKNRLEYQLRDIKQIDSHLPERTKNHQNGILESLKKNLALSKN